MDKNKAAKANEVKLKAYCEENRMAWDCIETANTIQHGMGNVEMKL